MMSNHDVILRGIFVGPRREGTHRGYIRLDFYDLLSCHDKIFRLAVDFVGFRNCLGWYQIEKWMVSHAGRSSQPGWWFIKLDQSIGSQIASRHLTEFPFDPHPANQQAANCRPGSPSGCSAVSNFHFLSFLLEVAVICHHNFSKRALEQEVLNFNCWTHSFPTECSALNRDLGLIKPPMNTAITDFPIAISRKSCNNCSTSNVTAH